jgi:hypothetical protein
VALQRKAIESHTRIGLDITERAKPVCASRGQSGELACARGELAELRMAHWHASPEVTYPLADWASLFGLGHIWVVVST